MLRPRHRDAAVVAPRVSAIASPRRAEALVHQVAVFRDLDLGAGAAPRHVADLALPAGEGGVGEKGMLRQVDRRAGAAFPPEAPVAFPDVAGGGDMGVLGQIDGRATVALAAIAPVAFPADAEHGAMGVLRPVGRSEEHTSELQSL